MIEIFKKEYWSKSKAFLLPLTGIKKTDDFDITTYVKWGDYSIDNYQLVVKVEYGHRYPEFQEYLKENVLAHRDAFAREVYDFEGFSVLIFDLSEWSQDVEKFIQGQYSKMSLTAKKVIQDFHIFGNNQINITIWACLFPLSRDPLIEDMTAVDYVIEHYILGKNPKPADHETASFLRKSGELCSLCQFEKETLELEASQIDISAEMV